MQAKPLALRRPEDVAHSLSQRSNFVWLDANAAVNRGGQWSYLASDPTEIVEVSSADPDPLSALRAIEEQPGYWIGWIGYDAAWPVSGRIRRRHQRNHKLPVLWFARYPWIFAWDHQKGNCRVYGDVTNALDTLQPCHGTPLDPQVGSIVVDDPAQHKHAIAEALELIHAGQIYQVNLARRWRAQYIGDPLALYLAMRTNSPVPYGSFMRTERCAVLSRSMECFLDWEGPGGVLRSQPIKGTIAQDGQAFSTLSAQLRNDEKERAEHTMIVDLMRNDFGQVATPHSVKVVNPYAVFPYAALCHMVTTVQCQTTSSTGLERLLRAVFPPGSISGTPKRAAIEVIEQLEPAARGLFSGAIGIVFPDGKAKFSVAIRTATYVDRQMEYWAGGGIVGASLPERELQETNLKAKVFLDAINHVRKRTNLEAHDCGHAAPHRTA